MLAWAVARAAPGVLLIKCHTKSTHENARDNSQTPVLRADTTTTSSRRSADAYIDKLERDLCCFSPHLRTRTDKHSAAAPDRVVMESSLTLCERVRCAARRVCVTVDTDFSCHFDVAALVFVFNFCCIVWERCLFSSAIANRMLMRCASAALDRPSFCQGPSLVLKQDAVESSCRRVRTGRSP